MSTISVWIRRFAAVRRRSCNILSESHRPAMQWVGWSARCVGQLHCCRATTFTSNTIATCCSLQRCREIYDVIHWMRGRHLSLLWHAESLAGRDILAVEIKLMRQDTESDALMITTNSTLEWIVASASVTIRYTLWRTAFTCTELKGHCFVYFSFWLRVLD